MAAAVSADGSRMLEELLEEASDLGLDYKNIYAVRLKRLVPNELSSVWDMSRKMFQRKRSERMVVLNSIQSSGRSAFFFFNDFP